MDNEKNNRKKEKEQLKSQTTTILVLSIAVLLFGLYDFIQSFIKLGEIEAIHRQTLLGKGLMAVLMAGLIGYIAYNIKRGQIFVYKNTVHSLGSAARLRRVFFSFGGWAARYAACISGRRSSVMRSASSNRHF